MSETIPGLELRDHNEQQTPCVLILDCSLSMSEKGKIDNLHRGLAKFEMFLKEQETVRRRVKVLMIRCGGSAEKIGDWVDGADFHAPSLQAAGDTPLGQAVNIGLQEIQRLKERYKSEGRAYTRPVMIIMTDGYPTDDGWELAAQNAQKAMEGKHVQIWPVPIMTTDGEGADLDKLRPFKKADHQFIVLSAPQHFDQFFAFLGQALEMLSTSTPGQTISPVPIYPAAEDSPKITLVS